LKIRDLGSRNGTYLNGQRVQEAVAKPGDHMKVGPLTFVFQINGHPEKIDTPEQESPRKAAPTNRPSDSNFAQFSDLDDLGSPGGSGLPDGPDSLG
jgi:pSer/pThr/pTyr-binding forkhead associated (FHA) protein